METKGKDKDMEEKEIDDEVLRILGRETHVIVEENGGRGRLHGVATGDGKC